MDPLKELLTSAMHEIRDLRRHNEILSAKVEMIDLFACVLHTQAASRSQGMAPDVAWQLQKKIDELSDVPMKSRNLGDFGAPTPNYDPTVMAGTSQAER